MKSDQLSFRPGFRLSVGNARSQAAVMVLPAGGKEGGPDNNHRGADQWLFVVSGRGVAKVGGKRMVLRKSSLLLIERGQNHEIENNGTTDLVTLNFYVPAAYTKAATVADTAQIHMTRRAPREGGISDIKPHQQENAVLSKPV